MDKFDVLYEQLIIDPKDFVALGKLAAFALDGNEDERQAAKEVLQDFGYQVVSE